MTKLQKLHKEILKHKKAIEMIKNTKGLDFDFADKLIKESKGKIIKLQEEFDKEWIYQNF